MNVIRTCDDATTKSMKSFVIFLYLFIVCSADDYSQRNGESLEDYARRLLARHGYESNDEYEVRIAFLEVLKPNLPIWKNYNYLKYITVEGNSISRPSYVPKYLDDLVQKKEENSTQFYKRIFERRSDEDDYQYMERVSILRGLLNVHSIWLNRGFVEYVKPHIRLSKDQDALESQTGPGYRDDLKQKNGESKEDYYTRILARHTYESNDEYEVRVAFLQPLTPELPIWKNHEYLKYVTVENNSNNRPSYVPKYLEDITQKTGENSDQYYKRIFKWHSDENDYEYMERISILRGLLNLQNIWINNDFMRYVTPYILKRVKQEQLNKQNQGSLFKQKGEIKSPTLPNIIGNHLIQNNVKNDHSNGRSYTSPSKLEHKSDDELDGGSDYHENLKQKSSESKEDYYTRILTRHAYGSNDEFEVRIAFLQLLTSNLPIWKNYEYLKYITVENTDKSRPAYEPKYLDDLVQKKDENSDQYYKRIFERHSDENDYQYMERIAILRGLLKEHNLWLNNNFMTYVKPHILKSLQKKRSPKIAQGDLSTLQEDNKITLTKPLSNNAEGDHRGDNNNLPTSSKQQSSDSENNGFSNEKNANSPKTKQKVDGSDEEDEDEFNDAAAFKKRDDESLKAFCMRVFAKRPFETDASFRKTIKRMMERWLQFEMWREKCKPYVDLDALLCFNKYKRLNGESKSAYCRRLFEKRFYETDEKFKSRMAKTKSRFSEFGAWQQKCKEYVKSDNLYISN